MNWIELEQKSQEWWGFKIGKVSGTRFGKVISGKKNILKYEMLNEKLNGYILPTDYINDDMQYGIDNEETAIALYEDQTGMKFKRGGVIMSDFSQIHLSSPDAVELNKNIVVEVKCTMDGAKHIQRFFEGVESAYLPQIKNYFACSNTIEEVHFLSYCGYRPEKQLIPIIFKRDAYEAEIKKGRELINQLEVELKELECKFVF